MKILNLKVKEIKKSTEFTKGEYDFLKEEVKAKDDQMTKLQQDHFCGRSLRRRTTELPKRQFF